MGIDKFIKKVCVQTAVYWDAPIDDGYGGFIYSVPVEIDCRWQDKSEMITNSKGINEICGAEILLTQDVETGGWLFLGTLDDIDSSPDPMEVEGAYMIARFDKIPMIKSTTIFVRKAFLSQRHEQGG